MARTATTRARAEAPTPDLDRPLLGDPGRNVVLSDPHGEAAESIYALRGRIQSQHLQSGRRALAICGPSPEVGCSFVAVNLAVALAQIGVKTLLLDGDLRSPSVQSYFEPELTGPGLYGCLMSPSEPVVDFIHEGVVPNLDVMVAGHPSLTAHELLAGDGFEVLMNTCLRDYDMTIVDTPPANSCADGLRISTVVGFSLIVARKQMTLISDVRLLAEEMNKERIHIVGTVLNSY
jgi:protein-tyrosine kinase